MADIQVGDTVVMHKSGHQAEVVGVGTVGCVLIFPDDAAYAKQHGLPRTQFEVWFPNDEFRKAPDDEVGA